MQLHRLANPERIDELLVLDLFAPILVNLNERTKEVIRSKLGLRAQQDERTSATRWKTSSSEGFCPIAIIADLSSFTEMAPLPACNMSKELCSIAMQNIASAVTHHQNRTAGKLPCTMRAPPAKALGELLIQPTCCALALDINTEK
jgi:hypothetical protein